MTFANKIQKAIGRRPALQRYIRIFNSCCPACGQSLDAEGTCSHTACLEYITAVLVPEDDTEGEEMLTTGRPLAVIACSIPNPIVSDPLVFPDPNIPDSLRTHPYITPLPEDSERQNSYWTGYCGWGCLNCSLDLSFPNQNTSRYSILHPSSSNQGSKRSGTWYGARVNEYIDWRDARNWSVWSFESSVDEY